MEKLSIVCLLFISFSMLGSADGKLNHINVKLFKLTQFHSACLPKVGKWIVSNQEKNITCLVVQMDIKVNFTYTISGKNIINRFFFRKFISYLLRIELKYFFLYL